MTFIEQVSQKAIPVWKLCLDTDFVQNMGKGTLTKEKFAEYIVQDSIYLRRYASVLAMGIVKADNIKTVKTFYSLLAFVNAGEGNTRIKYLKDFGLTEDEADSMPEHPANKAYTDFMMECAIDGGRAEILFSALPCMFSYYWIFTELIKQYPDCLNSYFKPFLMDYTDDIYADICKNWAEYAENLCKNLSSEEKIKLEGIYIRSSQYELDFWKM